MGLRMLLAGPPALSAFGKPTFPDVVFCSIQGPLSGSATLLCPGSQVPEYATHSLKKFRKYLGFPVELNLLFKKVWCILRIQ